MHSSYFAKRCKNWDNFFPFGGGDGGLKVEVFEVFGSNMPLVVLINASASAKSFPSKEKPKHIVAKIRQK